MSKAFASHLTHATEGTPTYKHDARFQYVELCTLLAASRSDTPDTLQTL